MPLFDAYLIVDWSAAGTARTGKDSIWWALVERHGKIINMTKRRNPPTRAIATTEIGEILADLTEKGHRTLVGFDFPFGYPDGTALRLGMQGLPWRHMWQSLSDNISDSPDNRNNRIDVAEDLNHRISGEAFPFWGNVREEQRRYLKRRGRRPHCARDIDEWRICDRYGKTTSSVWQLAGNGSVGSQVLMGIPRVWQLRTDPRLAMHAHVWPFETGLRHDPLPRVIFAEVYPSLLEPAPEEGMVKDARQVRTSAEYFAVLDRENKLEVLFSGAQDLTMEARRKIESEEAWILGVTEAA